MSKTVDLNIVQLSRMARTMSHMNYVICGNIMNNCGWIKLPMKYLNIILKHVRESVTREEIYLSLSNEPEGQILIYILDNLFEVNFLCIQENINNFINTITIDVTADCNLLCSHCSGSFSGKRDLNMKDELISKLIVLSNKNHVKHLSFSGGEPFIRSDFGKILQKTRRLYKGTIEVLTNGTLIAEKDYSVIKSCVDILNISLDGYDEKSVEKIRGKGIYNKVLSTIDRLRKFGYDKIKVSMIMTESNRNNVNKFFKMCKNMKVEPVVRDIIYSGRAKANFLNSSLSELPRVINKKSDLNMKCMCASGIYSISVSYDGKIYPCSTFQGLGLCIDDIDDFIDNNNKKLSYLIPAVDVHCICKRCPVRYFCGTHCPATNYSIYSNEKLRKAYCKKQIDKLMELVWNIDFRPNNANI